MTSNKQVPEAKNNNQDNPEESLHSGKNNALKKEPSNYYLKTLFKGFLVFANTLIITLILTLSVFIGLLLGSESSREWLVQGLLPKLLLSDSIQLTINEFNSPTPGYWYFESISLNINEQNIIHANKLLLDFKLSALFDRKLDITELSADSLLFTLPNTNIQKQAPVQSEQNKDWQDILIPTRIQKLALQHIEIKGSDLDLATFQVNGKAELLWQDSYLVSDLSIKSKATPSAQIRLQAMFDNQFSGTINASIREDAGGWLGKTIMLPNEQAVDFNLELSAKADDSLLSWKLHSFKMPLLKYKVNAEAQGLWSNSEQKLELTQSSIFIDQKEQNIKGWWQGTLFEIETRLSELPIGLADAFQEYIVGGKVSGTVLAQGSISNPNIKTNLQADSHYNKQAVSISLKGEGDFETFNIEDAFLKLGGAQLKTSGAIFIDQQTMDLQVHQLSGPVRIVELFDVQLPDHLYIDINQAQGTLKGAFTAPNYAGLTQAKGRYKQQIFEATTKFDGDIDKVTLTNFIANTSGSQITADGLIDWSKENFDLSLATKKLPLSLLSLLNIELPESLSALVNTQGVLSGSFTLPSYKGEASATGNYQNTQFNITSVLNSSLENVEITDLSASLAFIDQNNEKQESSLQAHGTFTPSSKQLKGKIKVQALPYSAMTLAGIDMPKHLAGMLNADLAISGKLPLPSLYGSINSEGIYQGQAFNFNFDGSQKDKALTFDDTKFIWNDTILSANGSVREDNLDLHVELQALKLTDLNAFGLDLKPGNVDLHFNLLGSLKAPKLDGLVKLRVKDFDQTEDLNGSQEDIIVTSEFQTVEEKLVLTSDVTQGEKSRGHLLITSQFKPVLNWLISDAGEQDLAKLPLDINTKGNVGLNWINHFIDRDIQNISGELTLDAQLKGSLEQPRLKGSLDLLNGSYDNALSQTSIKDAEIKLAFDEKSIHIVKAEANDGYKGKINLIGKIDLADGDNGLVDITLNLNKASIVRREDIEGDVSGSIQLSGDLKNMLVKGDIDIAPFQIMLNLIPKDAIPEIEVSVKEDGDKEQKGRIKLPYVGLEVLLTVEQQAYIRGRGLDAELKGKLKLAGSMTKPSYNGQFNVIRGSFELFAKTFKLEEGDVLFSNDAVSLFVQGRYKGKDLTFIASLSGTLDDLQIGLRTEPFLPEDEALARLLFGRSVRNITPFQAIQLASAIQTLRGEGGKFDPLGTARDILHVDNISIESQETTEGGNGLAVGLGKYITEGVYVEIARTPEPTQPWKGSIEVELTPNINLETTTGGSSGFGGVELQWKNDY